MKDNTGPEMVELNDPNPYANYKDAMASDKAHPMAYEWQKANAVQIAAATKVEVLESFVKDEASALGLLSQVKGAYETDPLVATQIASVTQLVMCPKCSKASTGRMVWVAALERVRAETKDEYIRTFCDQQLRLCK